MFSICVMQKYKVRIISTYSQLIDREFGGRYEEGKSSSTKKLYGSELLEMIKKCLDESHIFEVFYYDKKKYKNTDKLVFSYFNPNNGETSETTIEWKWLEN